MRVFVMPLLVAAMGCVLCSQPVLAKTESKSPTTAVVKAKAAVGKKAAAPAKKAAIGKRAESKPAVSKSKKVAASKTKATKGKVTGASKASSKVRKAAGSTQSARSGPRSKSSVKTSAKAKAALNKSSAQQRAAAKRSQRLRASRTEVEDEAELPQMSAADYDPHASERVYDGLLPTVGEKIVMAAVPDEHGRPECVQLLKSLMNAPRTLFWKEGRKLKSNLDAIQPGTAIATFKKGRYPQQGRGRGTKHAAIFLRASEGGIWVFDQFVGKSEAAERFIPWHHPRDKRPSNNATAYSTVRW